MEDQEHPDESDSVLENQRLDLPIDIGEGVLEETSDIFECSPLLCHIAGLSCGSYELSEVTVGLLGQSSIHRKFCYI